MGFLWPSLPVCQRSGDIISVAVIVHSERKRQPIDHTEDLERHIALLQAGQVHMPVGSALEQIAIPEQGVGMQIHHRQCLVQLGRCRISFVGRID